MYHFSYGRNLILKLLQVVKLPELGPCFYKHVGNYISSGAVCVGTVRSQPAPVIEHLVKGHA